MKRLSSNYELREYLQWLSKTLEERQARDLSKAVAHASKISPFMSTEFLGESRIALKCVMKGDHGVLTDQERDDVRQILAQIDGAFDRTRYFR